MLYRNVVSAPAHLYLNKEIVMDPRVKRMAKVLVDYSCNVQRDDYVIIQASSASADLVLALEERILRKGAFPITRISLPGQSYVYYKNATRKHLTHLSDLIMHETRSIQARISIIDDVNTRELSQIDPKKLALSRKTHKPVKDYVLDPKNRVRWCVTLFPTTGLAQDAEMSLSEFENFVFSALFVDKGDPVKRWQELSKKQQRLTEIITNGNEVRIIGKETDLKMSIKGRIGINCDGYYNMPDGEVFTGPVEDSVEGKILFVTYPAIIQGKEIVGVRLTFQKGKIVEASAEKGDDVLQALLNTDEGARYLGELGIGNNFGIQRFIKEILFDEKIGGTIHLAFGGGYPETGSKNNSAVHCDLIMDLREGSLLIDGKKLVRKGDTLEFES